MHVHAHADQAAGQGALVLVAAGHVSRVRATRAHGHAKALRGAHHDVGAHVARGLEQRERQQVSGHDEGGGLPMALCGIAAEVFYQTGAAGVLHQRGEMFGVQCRVEGVGTLGDQHLNAQGFGAGLDDLDGLWMASA